MLQLKKKADEKLGKEIAKKQKTLVTDIDNLESTAKELIKRAEENRDFSLTVQSNALFQKADAKKEELKDMVKRK